MDIDITKTDLDKTIPAAREPKGTIFKMIEEAILLKADEIGRCYLGEPGIQAVEDRGNSSYDPLRWTVKQLACLSAFLAKMRSLDLVLTSTGFGVVSTNDTAPASKMRVDALEGELKRRERVLRSQMIEQLFKVSGWSRTKQRQASVFTLFWDFAMLEMYAGISNPRPEDWDSNVPEMLSAETFLRKHIGSSYMAALHEAVTSDSVGEKDFLVVLLCQKFIGASVAKNIRLKEELYRQLINLMESEIGNYPLYAGSEAYQLNHFTPYENHAEDTAFHFVG